MAGLSNVFSIYHICIDQIFQTGREKKKWLPYLRRSQLPRNHNSSAQLFAQFSIFSAKSGIIFAYSYFIPSLWLLIKTIRPGWLMGIIKFCYGARKNITNKKALTVLSPSPFLVFMDQRCQRLEGVYTNIWVKSHILWICLKMFKNNKRKREI